MCTTTHGVFFLLTFFSSFSSHVYCAVAGRPSHSGPGWHQEGRKGKVHCCAAVHVRGAAFMFGAAARVCVVEQLRIAQSINPRAPGHLHVPLTLVMKIILATPVSVLA